MLFSNLKIDKNKQIYIQIKEHIKLMITKGLMPNNSKLPSTRELSEILNVSRNSVVLAYEDLKSEGYIYSLSGKGTFAKNNTNKSNTKWSFNWFELENDYCKISNELDIIKTEIPWEKGLISFKSISPNGELFDVDELKKSFLNRISLEGHKILNYGYAKGYLPLINYLNQYMNEKGINTENKDLLITNGFTEGFELIVSSFLNTGDYIICENPTHNTTLKILKSYKINIIGIDIDENGFNFDMLKSKLKIYGDKIKFSYITPSYHNPTGTVMPPDNRYKFYNIMKDYNIPIIEDGFSEELLYSSSHVFPIASLDNLNNGVIYIGSFSKILFPGIRVGWILGDKDLVSKLESVKRIKNIHVSFLDQAILYDYLYNGGFEKYIKKVRKFYKEKFNFIYECAKKYIPCEYILGEGGLHLFIKLHNINSRELLRKCHKKGVIFMPGDIFYSNNEGFNTLRLGFSRLSFEEIECGIKIIGETIKNEF